MVERINSGIHGLDNLVEGGFPENSTVLIAGGAGTGKTIFCCQYLWQGLQNGENCLFITVEENDEDIIEDAAQFGWDFGQYEDSFEIEYLNPFQIRGGLADQMPLNDRINSLIQKLGADRVVIDSVSVLGMRTEGDSEVRQQLYELINLLKKNDVTTVMTAEIPGKESDKLSRFGVEEFVSDAVLVLKGIGVGGEMGRRLIIEKMRRTNIDEDIYPIKFTEDGLKVEEPEKGLSL